MEAVDRRLSVAPMMDWTDNRRMFLCVKHLAASFGARLLYVSSSSMFARIMIAE